MRRSRAAQDEERMAFYQEAAALYQGDFLPRQENHMWVVPLAAHYHALYVEMVKDTPLFWNSTGVLRR